MKNVNNESAAKALMVMATEALNAIKQLAELEMAELTNKPVRKVKENTAVKEAKTTDTKPVAKISDPKLVEAAKPARRKRAGNNRVEILNGVFEKFGFDADPEFLFKEVNKRSVEAGLTPIKMSSFYVMMNTAKRWKKETEGS
jgi:hypothetical protein